MCKNHDPRGLEFFFIIKWNHFMANMKSQGGDSTIYVISYPKGLTLEWLLNLIIEGKKPLRVNRITLNVWKFF